MKQAQEAGKRIVSKREYVTSIGKKWSLSSFGIISFSTCGLWVLLTILMLFELATPDLPPGDMDAIDKTGLRHSILCCTVYSLLLLTFGVCAMRKASKINPGVPLTRANTADLRAPDSLVRASQEPAQAQEGVLLRAATGETQEGQDEQLLRALAGEQV